MEAPVGPFGARPEEHAVRLTRFLPSRQAPLAADPSAAPIISNPEQSQVKKLQDQILQMAQHWPRPPSPAVEAAFRSVPRHAFVRQYRRDGETIAVTRENLSQHLSAIYANGVLRLWEDPEKGILSTISQPTLVLWMLELLELARGQAVFELGAGSGWNAALLGHLVAPSGRVYSTEIIPELAEAARRTLAENRIPNVEIVTGDGGDGFAAGAPFDRAVFTAGSYDLPRAFHAQVRVGGLLLIVVKVEGGGDQLILLERRSDCFESKYGAMCAFVPMMGKHAFAGDRPVLLETLPGWTHLGQREVEQRPFWWGASDDAGFWASTGVRSFLSVAEPLFRVFREEGKAPADPQHWFAGLFDADAQSLVVARKGMLVSYGNVTARDRLFARLHEWVDLGMPSMAAMNVRIFPADADVRAAPQQWVVKRSESTFVWRLKGRDEART